MEVVKIGDKTHTEQGYRDMLVVKYDPQGALLWSTSFGGEGNDQVSDVATDSAGNAYLTGSFQQSVSVGSTDLVAPTTPIGNYDIFVIKLDPNGTPLWATSAGGLHSDRGYALAVDSTGHVYVTGHFEETATFGSTTLSCASLYYSNIFIAKLSPSGSFVWATSVSSSGENFAHDVTLTPAGTPVVVGQLEETATFGGGQQLTSKGGSDLFVWHLAH